MIALGGGGAGDIENEMGSGKSVSQVGAPLYSEQCLGTGMRDRSRAHACRDQEGWPDQDHRDCFSADSSRTEHLEQSSPIEEHNVVLNIIYLV